MGKKEAERWPSEKDSTLVALNMDEGQETSNVGNLKSLEKAQETNSSPRSSIKKCSPANTLILAQ